MGQGGTNATASINLNAFDNGVHAGACSLIATDTGSYGSTFKINSKIADGFNYNKTTYSIIYRY